MLKEEILHNSQQSNPERTFPNSFYKANVTLIPKADKDTTSKEKYKITSSMNTDTKNLPQNSSKSNPIMYKKELHTMTK